MTVDNVSMKTAVLVALWLFLQTYQSASSFKITRGDHDSVWYGDDYDQMVNHTDLSTMNCSVSNKECQCNKNDGYNTIIYNTTFVKCVKDEDEAILGHKIYGEYINNSKGRCLQVKDQEIVEVPCRENDLSLLWQRLEAFHLLNIKALKCLQRQKNLQNFTVAQCKDNPMQLWAPDPNETKKILPSNEDVTAKPLYSNLLLTEGMSYKGCYRVSGDKMLDVVKLGTSKNITITFNAPIFEGSGCKIDNARSTYSTLGETWIPLYTSIFSLGLEINGKVTLHITNSSRLFRQLPGTLVRLGITCSVVSPAQNEKQCVILKIEGVWENKTSKITMPSTTLPATSSSTSPPTSSVNSSSMSPATSSAILSSTSPVTTSPTSTVGSSLTSKLSSTPTSSSKKSTSTPPVKKDSKISSMLYIIPIVVLICLLIIALVIIFFCCRRRKRPNSGKDLHIYEESTFSNSKGAYEDPSQMTKMKQLNPHSYVTPGPTIPAGRVYDEPTTPTLPNSGQKPPNNNNLQYDYATREETSLLPLILNGDTVLKDDPPNLPKSRPARQSSEKPFYHTLDEGKSGSTDSNAGQPYGNPLYYTLEAGKPDPSQPAANEPDENGKNSQEQSVYHTLENNYEDVDNIKSQ